MAGDLCLGVIAHAIQGGIDSSFTHGFFGVMPSHEHKLTPLICICIECVVNASCYR